MAKVSHNSPQKTRTGKSRKSVLKTYNRLKQNEQILEKLQNGKL